MNNKRWDALWLNALIATCAENGKAYGLLQNAAIAVKGDKIAWIGEMAELPGSHSELAERVYDLTGKCITPGLIDCHTHLVYAGNRYNEFEMRLKGASYAEIAQAGGGIRSTVAATRAASEQELLQQSLRRAEALISEGVTTIEIKSGYGLDLVTELKILRVAKRIGELLPVTVSLTFLGAHALPPEYQGKADDYIDLVCNEMIPQVANEKLANTVDVFCETIGFTLAQTKKVFDAAKKYGLGLNAMRNNYLILEVRL